MTAYRTSASVTPASLNPVLEFNWELILSLITLALFWIYVGIPLVARLVHWVG